MNRAAVIPPKLPVTVVPIEVEHTTIEPVIIPPVTEAKAGLAWWILPLILLGLLLCLIVLCCIFCAARKKENEQQPIRQEKPHVLTAVPPQLPQVVEEPERKFVIKRKLDEEDEAQVDAEIAAHLKSVALQKEKQMRSEEEEKKKIEEESKSIQRQRGASNHEAAGSDDGRASVKSGRSGRSSRSPGSRGSGSQGGSSKKVVRKRIVKMMKQGKLVAEKEEILDEEGKVIRTQLRKDFRKSPDKSPTSQAQ